jgi:colanic acid/amylovoran biosynthesis glycosyltransferase
MYNIAIVSYNNDKYSEPFIHNLVKYLPFHTHYMYEDALPKYYGNGQRFLNEEGINQMVISWKEWLGTSRFVQHQKVIEKYLIGNNIKAVHANYAITAFPIMDICRRIRIPLIVHFRGWTAYRKTVIERYRKEYYRLFTIAETVVCVSSDMKRQLMGLGCPESKIEIIPSGANTMMFQYSDHSSNSPTFLAAGRFCDTKNPHLTILAFSKVLRTIPDARLLMAGGDENLLCACINLCKALKMENQVIFKGVQTYKEMVDLMKSSLAFVQHSATTILDEKEGTPNSIMEACSSGLIVIATRHAGIADVIINQETGLLSDEFDLDAMADNMIRIAQDRQLAKKLGENAATRVYEYFTMKQCLDKLTAVILNAIEC